MKYASIRYKSLKDLESKVQNKYKKEQDKIIRNMRPIINSGKKNLDKIIELRKYAKTNYKGYLYSDEIEEYLKFKTINLDVFSNEDKKEVNNYLSMLDKKMLPTYVRGLNNKSEYNEMDFLYPEGKSNWYAKHSYEFGKILTSSDLFWIRSLFNEIIKAKALANYTRSLSNEELTLLIKAKAYFDPNKNTKRSSIDVISSIYEEIKTKEECSDNDKDNN